VAQKEFKVCNLAKIFLVTPTFIFHVESKSSSVMVNVLVIFLLLSNIGLISVSVFHQSNTYIFLEEGVQYNIVLFLQLGIEYQKHDQWK